MSSGLAGSHGINPVLTTDDKHLGDSMDTKAEEDGRSSPNSVAEMDAEGRKLYGGVSIIPLWKTYLLLFGLSTMTAANSAAIQSMNVAVGFIAVALNFKPQEIQWIVSAYTLSSGCLLLLFIPLCTQFGHREIFRFAVVVYIAGAIGCACAQNAMQFIALRVVMGIGACSGIPSGFGILSNTLPVLEHSTFRALSLGVYAAGAPLGSALGTIFGGLPTGLSAIKWRGIFAVLAGLGGLSFITTVWTAPPNKKEKVPGGPDWIGTAIGTVALTLVLFCLSQGPADGWGTPYIIAVITIGCLLFPVFVFYEIWVERRGNTPMLRMSNFRRGRYGLINFLGFFGFMSFAVWDYFSGLFYAQIKGLGAVDIMLRFIPQAIGGVTGAISANWLLRRISTQYVFCIGALCAALAGTIFAVSKPEDTYWNGAQFLAFFLGITGACYVYASSMLYNVSVVVPSEIGAAGGLFQVMTSLAPAFGNVISTIVLSNQIQKDPENPSNLYKAFQHAYWTGAGFGYFALIVAIPGLYGIGTLGKSGESARVQQLVLQHHETDLFAGEKKKDVESMVPAIVAPPVVAP